MVTIDGDTSTNDTLVLLANGQSGAAAHRRGRAGARGTFQAALDYVCVDLARSHRRRRRGGHQAHPVMVRGAASLADARRAARVGRGQQPHQVRGPRR